MNRKVFLVKIIPCILKPFSNILTKTHKLWNIHFFLKMLEDKILPLQRLNKPTFRSLGTHCTVFAIGGDIHSKIALDTSL